MYPSLDFEVSLACFSGEVAYPIHSIWRKESEFAFGWGGNPAYSISSYGVGDILKTRLVVLIYRREMHSKQIAQAIFASPSQSHKHKHKLAKFK